MPINKTLLAKVRDKILANPESYDQSTFGRKSTKAPCGTQACIAGWAYVLDGGPVTNLYANRGYDIEGAAREALGLTCDEADTLFSDGRWPEEFQEKFNDAANRAEQAQAAAEYLNHIIETGDVGRGDDDEDYDADYDY